MSWRIASRHVTLRYVAFYLRHVPFVLTWRLTHVTFNARHFTHDTSERHVALRGREEELCRGVLQRLVKKLLHVPRDAL